MQTRLFLSCSIFICCFSVITCLRNVIENNVHTCGMHEYNNGSHFFVKTDDSIDFFFLGTKLLFQSG